MQKPMKMYSRSLSCTCLCGRFSASCTRISSTYASEIWAQLTKNLLAKSSTKRFREYIDHNKITSFRKATCCFYKQKTIKKQSHISVGTAYIFMLHPRFPGLVLLSVSFSPGRSHGHPFSGSRNPLPGWLQ